MKKILLPAIVTILLIGCDKEFEPELKGWQAYTWPTKRVHLNLDGRQKTIELPGDERTVFRYPQWTKLKDNILLLQMMKTEVCYNYQIVSIDTTGSIIDTVYTAPPNTAVNSKLSPNDSLLLLKTYYDNCEESNDYKYTFYNRFLNTSLPDTIAVDNARGILLPETIWSPDSKKVIISQWFGNVIRAFAYDLVTKDTTEIGTGSNFIWSPTDKNLVAYIKDYSIYGMNIKTGEREIIYEGKKKKSVASFRWSPDGEFLMLHIQTYLLNVEKGMFAQRTIRYWSLKDKAESKTFYDDQRIDTWK